MTDTLTALEGRRRDLVGQLGKLGDLRRGSITGTGGRCGNPNCHCHGKDDPGHAPHLRLTYKSKGKTVTESFPTPTAQRKVEREISEFRRYQELSRSFLDVSEKICRLRPAEEQPVSEQEKKRRRPSKRKSRAK